MDISTWHITAGCNGFCCLLISSLCWFQLMVPSNVEYEMYCFLVVVWTPSLSCYLVIAIADGLDNCTWLGGSWGGSILEHKYHFISCLNIVTLPILLYEILYRVVPCHLFLLRMIYHFESCRLMHRNLLASGNMPLLSLIAYVSVMCFIMLYKITLWWDWEKLDSSLVDFA